MKPRNKREEEVVRLSGTLPRLTTPQKDYAFEHCFEHMAIIRKKGSRDYFCLECGKCWTEWGQSELSDTLFGVDCPGCHRHLSVGISRRRSGKEITQTFQTITTAGGFQVTRTYHAVQYTIPGSPAQYWIKEVSQVWQQPEGRDIVVALPRVAQSFYVDRYNYRKSMSIKTDSQDYHIYATVIYPRRKVLPSLVRNGYCRAMYDFHPTETFSLLWNSPHHETLAKVGRFDIWKELSSYQIREHWQQIKIMIRHDYRPKDLRMWYDTVCIASNLGLDINSPKYILPAELKEMHDMLNRRAERKRKKEEQERRRAEIAKKKKLEKWYFKYNGKLLGICIHSGDIDIKPLQNYKEFCDEGDSMHHCVETYWGRKDCLILSARSHGIRLATIELDRKDFHIKQCRAAGNEQPERFKEICSLINSSTDLFFKADKQNSNK